MAQANTSSAVDGEIVDLIPALRAFARTFCSDPDDADVLVEDTLLKAIEEVDRYRSGTPLKTWLFALMRNSFRDRICMEGRDRSGSIEGASARAAREAMQH